MTEADGRGLEAAIPLRDFETLAEENGQVRLGCTRALTQQLLTFAQGGMPVRKAARIGPEDGLPLPEGRYVRISVEDQGCGIPEENLQRMFDPCFTPKPEGTGLGLAITDSIVKKHEGHIRGASAVGRGDVCEVFLPACVAPAPTAAPGEAEHPLAGGGRILVLDDEEIIRDAAWQMLHSLGYKVDLAGGGAEAVRLVLREG